MPRRICLECSEPTEARQCPGCGAPTVLELGTGEVSDPLIGASLDDRYQIVRPLGQGGMGTVYEAVQLGMNRSVAIKLVRPRLATDQDAVRRFFREIRAASSLSHHHTVRVFDHGQTDEGHLYMVMEHLAGHTLEDILRHEGRLPVERALAIAIAICESLAEAHGLGLVHRDLKPANVMLLDRVGHPDFVKVLDFGIAKFVSGSSSGSSLTSSAVLIGTPHYMAPEQMRPKAERGELTADADVYALGVMLFQMMCGRRPYEGETSIEILMAHLLQPVPALPEDCDAPDGLRALVARLLDKDPAARPSVIELLGRLRGYLAPTRLSAPSAPPTPPPDGFRATDVALGVSDETEVVEPPGASPGGPVPRGAALGVGDETEVVAPFGLSPGGPVLAGAAPGADGAIELIDPQDGATSESPAPEDTAAWEWEKA